MNISRNYNLQKERNYRQSGDVGHNSQKEKKKKREEEREREIVIKTRAQYLETILFRVYVILEEESTVILILVRWTI